MATAVLRSSDCLKNRFHLDAFASRPPPPPSAKPHRKKSPSAPKSARRNPPSPPSRSPSPKSSTKPLPSRRSPPPPPGKPIAAALAPKKGLVMENVKILKRGEDLDSVAADFGVSGADSEFCTTDRIGPEPEMMPRKLGFVDLDTVYAGPTCYASPSPSALPRPGFLVGNEYLATKTLRCILRLD